MDEQFDFDYDLNDDFAAKDKNMIIREDDHTLNVNAINIINKKVQIFLPTSENFDQNDHISLKVNIEESKKVHYFIKLN